MNELLILYNSDLKLWNVAINIRTPYLNSPNNLKL